MSRRLLKTHSRCDAGDLLLALHYTELLFHVVVKIYIYEFIKSHIHWIWRCTLSLPVLRKYLFFRRISLVTSRIGVILM
jgi:hypothetical protein